MSGAIHAPFQPTGACEICGKPLGQRRLRQGVRAHPGCKKCLPPVQLDAALGLAQATLAKLPGSAEDPELKQLFAQAALEAQQLIDDLKRLRSFVGGANPQGRTRAAEERDSIS